MKQPKPPQEPEDCSELRRALALSMQSVASGHEKAVEIARQLGSDEHAIYLAVIQQWNSGESTGLNVSAKTFPLDVTSFSERTGCACLTGFSAEELLKASHSFHVLQQSDFSVRGIRLVDARKHDSIVARNDPSRTMREGRSAEDAVDNAFANGLFSVSEIAFDKEQRHALVSYGFRCGMLCGSGAIWLFEKVNGRWTKADRDCGGWIS